MFVYDFKYLLDHLLIIRRQVHCAERLDRRPNVQDALHRAFPAVHESKIRGILCQMGERPFELCLCLP